MATDKEIRQAQMVYSTICDTLDDMNWTYDKDEENLDIYSGAGTDDYPIDIRINVSPSKALVTVLSEIAVDDNIDTRAAVSVGVSIINNRLVDGNFDYNMADGKMFFRITSSFKSSLLSKDVFDYMIYIACHTVDEYNDKLIPLSTGEWSFDEFLQKIHA